MEQQAKQYEPFPLCPLKVRGVFGIAWQIFRRGFWPMLLLTLVLTGLVSLVAFLSYGGSMASLLSLSTGQYMEPGFDYQGPAVELMFDMLSIAGVSTLLSLVAAFLLNPMYLGAANAEYSRRMRGGRLSLGGLFQSCGKGLTRYYTTYLANLLVEIGMGIALSIVIWLVAAVVIFGAAFGSISPYGSFGAGFILAIVLMVAVVLVISVIATMFLSFVYPVAVNENKRHFHAVGRSFRLVGRRFGRVLGVSLLNSLIWVVIGLLLCLPGMLMMFVPLFQSIQSSTPDLSGMAGGMIAMFAGALIAQLLSTPYTLALHTALYYDAAAREPEGPVFDPAQPLPQDAPSAAQPVYNQRLYDQPEQPSCNPPCDGSQQNGQCSQPEQPSWEQPQPGQEEPPSQGPQGV